MTTTIEIRTRGLTGFLAALRRDRSRFTDDIGAELDDIARGGAQALQDATPSRTDAARQGWRAERTGSLSSRILNDVPHTQYLLRPTAPHLIAPKDTLALRFLGSSGTLFARLVHHPGTQPNAALLGTLDHVEHQANERLERYGMRIVADLSDVSRGIEDDL